MNSLEQKLSRIDLNLLVSLSVLLKEKSVSRAADRLYLSQSAMSRTLQRLRDLFDDPLFHRTANGIIPTIKAQQIDLLLPDLLQKLDTIFNSEKFTPQLCEQHFSISMPALMSHSILLPLLTRTNIDAPLVQITEHSAKLNPYKYLESGFFDFSIHIEQPSDSNFIATYMGTVTPVIFARKGHPLTDKDRVSLQSCFDYSFLEFNVESDSDAHYANPINTMLKEQGLQRNIILKSSQLSNLFDILKQSDNLLIGPHFLFDYQGKNSEFEIVHELSTSKRNALNFYLVEHQRVANSPAHQWFKGLILEQEF